MQAGKEQLEKLAGDPAASRCWAAAVEELKAGCRSMDDGQRSRLAVKFTHCHLEKSGLETYPCTPEMSIAECTRPMVDSPSGIAYNAYTTFYTHAESMCYYLQSEAFQRATEVAVDLLHTSARGTARQLGQLQEQATAVVGATESILAEQQQASVAARELLDGQRAAAAELNNLQASQSAAFAKAETSLSELSREQHAKLSALKQGADELGAKQHALLGGLDRVLGLQQTLLGDFADVKSIIFYCCAVVLGLALTTTTRTAAARLPIFAFLSLNALAEKLVGSVMAAAGADQEAVHTAVTLLRRVAALACAGALLRAVLRHVDVAKRTLSGIDELKAMQRQSSDQMLSASETVRAKLTELEQQAAASRELARSKSPVRSFATQTETSSAADDSPASTAAPPAPPLESPPRSQPKLSPALAAGRMSVSPANRRKGGGRRSSVGSTVSLGSPPSTRRSARLEQKRARESIG